jgi:hypothetical protein
LFISRLKDVFTLYSNKIYVFTLYDNNIYVFTLYDNNIYHKKVNVNDCIMNSINKLLLNSLGRLD